MQDSLSIQNALAGAARMMFRGKSDGLRRMDLSVDGFWDSFAAILLAAPPLLVNSIAAAYHYFARPGTTGTYANVVTATMAMELAGWLLPLVLLGICARPVGLADRFVPYVVATNWASVIIAWAVLPISLIRLLMPDSYDLNATLNAVAYLTSLVLNWRLTNAAIDRGGAIATLVFITMLVSTIATVFSVAYLFGLD